MSGPIVRTGTNPKFWANWDRAFGKKSEESAAPPAKKSAAPKAAKKAAKKSAKKASKKK